MMGLFGKKNKDTEAAPCCCGGNCNPGSDMPAPEENKPSEGSSVIILGTGCTKCNQLEASTVEALKQLGMTDEMKNC